MKVGNEICKLVLISFKFMKKKYVLSWITNFFYLFPSIEKGHFQSSEKFVPPIFHKQEIYPHWSLKHVFPLKPVLTHAWVWLFFH